MYEDNSSVSSLSQLDDTLAARFGGFASYSTGVDPICVETYGDGPQDEVDRLLDICAGPDSRVLDLGCGAGFTLCRLAPRVAAIWGFDQDRELLTAARQRAAGLGLNNVTLVLGNIAEPSDVAPFEDDTFDLVLSRRGPNVNAALMPKLRSDARVIQELHQDPLGLLELFGRKSFLDTGDNPRWLIDEYGWLGLFPVSVKEYFYDLYFRDADHLAAYLSQSMMLYSWPMPPMPYEEARDRAALELYVRYHLTPRGVKVVNHRKVYLFRRAPVHYAPAVPEAKPLD